MLKELLTVLLVLSVIGLLLNGVQHLQGFNPGTSWLYIAVIASVSLYFYLEARYERD